MRGRPNLQSDEQLILNAQDIFWKKGYTATSLSDLSKATGAGAGSLYNSFKGGKKELFKKSLHQRTEALGYFKSLLDQSDDPIKLIKDFFMSIALQTRHEHLRGCIVANTLVEMTYLDEELENDAIEILKQTEELYTSIIHAEQKKGNLKTKVSASILGKYLITTWCGINSLRRIYPDNEILKQQIKLQLDIIK